MTRLPTADNPYHLAGLAAVVLIVFTLYAIFFFRSVKPEGIEKFFRFTLFTLTIGVVFNILNVVTQFFLPDLTMLLPMRANRFGWTSLAPLPFLFLLVFSILLYRRMSNPNIRLLKIVWIVLLCFNAGDVLLYLYSYFSWTEPVPIEKYGTTSERLILEHVRNQRRENYLLYLAYPALWTIICSIGVHKAFRPKRPNADSHS